MTSISSPGGWRDPIPERMHGTILLSTTGLGVVGLFGAFAAHADLPVISAGWAGMFLGLAKQTGHAMDRDTCLKVAAGVIVGIGGLAAGVKVANTWLAYTGVGTIPAMVCNAGTNAAMTYVIGRSAARVFLASDPGTSVEEMIRAIVRLFMPHGHRH